MTQMGSEPDMQIRNLLVTGGAGFIGSNFVRRCLTGTYPGILSSPSLRIIVLDALTYAGNLENLLPISSSSRYVFEHADIRDTEALRRIFTQYAIDAVVHFAAETHVDRSIHDEMAVFGETNVLGTQRLLEAAFRVKVKKFIHISTDEVYGSIPSPESSSESSLLDPSSPYSASKAASDLMVLAYGKTHKLPVCVTRSANNYGPYQFPEKVIPLFVTNLVDRKAVPLYGGGGQVRDWLHVDDNCRAIALVLLKGRPGQIYNIAASNERFTSALTTSILQLMDLAWSEDTVRIVKDRPGGDMRYSLDCRKIREELGWCPEVNFEEGLEEVVRWYKENRKWWEPLKEKAKLPEGSIVDLGITLPVSL